MKNFITEKEALLPLEGIEVMGDELMFILGGAGSGSGAGAGCGCGCKDGVGCGCGCGCEGNSPADNSPAQ